MCPFFTTLLLIGIIGVLIYLFLTWHFDYWKKRGIKCAKSYPFVGSFPSLFTQKRNSAYDINDIYCEYKDTENFVGVFSSRHPQLLILDPELAHKVFINDFHSFHDNELSKFTTKDVDKILANNIFVLTGDEWKERRAEVTAGLTASRINVVYPVTQEVCKRFVDFIRKQQKMSPPTGVDVKHICLCYTTEVVSDCVLGISAQSFTENPTPIVSMFERAFAHSATFLLYTALVNMLPQIRKIYVKSLFDKEIETFFIELMQKSIDLRRNNPDSDRIDFLNYMLHLQDKKNFDIMELTSHVMTFLTDGFETTAMVLTNTLLMLARYPDAQERLRLEVGKERLSFVQLSELPYLNACIHESIRILPPLLRSAKICTKHYELVNKDGRSITLEPGVVVIIPAFCIHHNADYYDEPEIFKPERFLESDGGRDLRKYRELGLYWGFGEGPRMCPGMRFALTQMKAALVEIVRNFNIKMNTKTRKDNKLHDTNFIGALHGGVWLDFQERV